MVFKKLQKRPFLGRTAANALHPHPSAHSATHPSHPGFFIKDELSDHRLLVVPSALSCLRHVTTTLPSSLLQLPSLLSTVHPSIRMVNKKSTYAYLVRHTSGPSSSPMFAIPCLELTFYHTTALW